MQQSKHSQSDRMICDLGRTIKGGLRRVQMNNAVGLICLFGCMKFCEKSVTMRKKATPSYPWHLGVVWVKVNQGSALNTYAAYLNKAPS